MSFDLFKKKSTNLNCFGKLPIYADFIKLGSENRELTLFDKWIQEGMHFAKTKLENGFEESYRGSLHYNFIFQPKNSDKSIIGILFPGQDKSGRYSPFVVFIITNKYQLGSGLGVFLSYLQDAFFPNASNIAKYGWTGMELGAFLKKFFNRDIILSYDKKYKIDYTDFIKSKTVGSYFEDLDGDSNGEKRYLILQNLLDIIKPLSKENFPRFSLGINFPLSSSYTNNRFEVTFWIDLLTKLLPVKRTFPSLFWSNEENKLKPNLLCYLNEPLPKHFLSLLDINSDLDDSLCDLSEMRFAKIDDIRSSMTEKNFTLLKNSEITLEHLLSSLARIIHKL